MTSNQFRSAIRRLDLSQVGAARLFRADPRTARRWALGERSIPPAVEILIKLMLAGKVTAEDIESV
jgi:hypothetical protein